MVEVTADQTVSAPDVVVHRRQKPVFQQPALPSFGHVLQRFEIEAHDRDFDRLRVDVHAVDAGGEQLHLEVRRQQPPTFAVPDGDLPRPAPRPRRGGHFGRLGMVGHVPATIIDQVLVRGDEE